METQEAILLITDALTLVSQETFDKTKIRTLKTILDKKHWQLVEEGLDLDDKKKLMHGLIGALSHYEAQLH